VVEFDQYGKAPSLEEKPTEAKSDFAASGLYFYDDDDNGAVSMARESSPPGEDLKITDLNRRYLEQGRLRVTVLPRGPARLDTGTFDSLDDAPSFVRTIESRQGLKMVHRRRPPGEPART